MSEKIIITHKVWKEIENTIGNSPPEAGGILGSKNEKIVDYYFDSTGIFQGNKYIPDIKQINSVIADWAECGILFCGFVHSHPISHIKPSYSDIEYVRKILKNTGLESLYLLIYLANADKRILMYELCQKGMFHALEYEID